MIHFTSQGFCFLVIMSALSFLDKSYCILCNVLNLGKSWHNQGSLSSTSVQATNSLQKALGVWTEPRKGSNFPIK